MTIIHQPIAARTTPHATIAGEMQLFRMLSLATSVASEHAVLDHALRLVSALQVLRPHQEDLTAMRAKLLCCLGHVHEAQDLVQGSSHPFSKAVLSMCALALGRSDAFDLAREAAATNDPHAMALAELILAEQPSPDDLHLTVAA